MVNRILSHVILWFVRTLRWTCRVRVDYDPRISLREAGQPYIYAGLHAQQFAFVTYGERNAATLVSRSKDGDLIIPTLDDAGVIPVRGSAGGGRKGSVAALRSLVNYIEGGTSICLAVDGRKDHVERSTQASRCCHRNRAPPCCRYRSSQAGAL